MERLALRPVQDEYPITDIDDDFGIDPEVTNPVELAAQEADHNTDLDNLPLPSQNCTISEIELAADHVASQRNRIRVDIWNSPDNLSNRIDELVSFFLTPNDRD